MTPSIVIADECDLTLRGIRAILEAESAYQLVGAVSAWPSLIALLEQVQPALVLYADSFVGIDALTLSDRIALAAPHTKRIVLGAVADGALISALLDAGVRGYLYRADALGDLLLTALEMVTRERFYLSPTANTEYLLSLHTQAHQWQLDEEARAVLRLLTQGYAPGQIAIQLGLRPRRVYWVRLKLRRR
ncbi:MAG: response regulator transcription factor, partial [Chloroflexota bacterium]|nr:response regulator transcription factor [Chloroflexota bacterium]